MSIADRWAAEYEPPIVAEPAAGETPPPPPAADIEDPEGGDDFPADQ